MLSHSASVAHAVASGSVLMLAAPGASLGDLKARMGHDSARAAMIYQHATAAADRAIAAALDRQIKAARQG